MSSNIKFSAVKPASTTELASWTCTTDDLGVTYLRSGKINEVLNLNTPGGIRVFAQIINPDLSPVDSPGITLVNQNFPSDPAKMSLNLDGEPFTEGKLEFRLVRVTEFIVVQLTYVEITQAGKDKIIERNSLLDPDQVFSEVITRAYADYSNVNIRLDNFPIKSSDLFMKITTTSAVGKITSGLGECEVDFNNDHPYIPSGSCFLFVDNFDSDFFTDLTTLSTTLANVLSHELGHALGLVEEANLFGDSLDHNAYPCSVNKLYGACIMDGACPLDDYKIDQEFRPFNKQYLQTIQPMPW